MEFKNSETRKNLMRAFAGESQARNRYTFAESQARKAKLQVVADLFHYTARQEKEHGEIFYNHLKELSGENIQIDGSYPVDITDSIPELLRMAQHNEYEEHNPVYQAFGEKAQEEGFPHVANSFFRIAEIEKTHGDRFGMLAEWMEQGKLFRSDGKEPWICLNCGYIYEGDRAPESCPVCYHDQGYFERLSYSPFSR